MRYFTLAWDIRKDGRDDSNLLERIVLRERLGTVDCSLIVATRTDEKEALSLFNVVKLEDGESRSMGFLEFGEVWANLRVMVGDSPVIIADLREKRAMLDVFIEEHGYLPLLDQDVIDGVWFARLLFPRVVGQDVQSVCAELQISETAVSETAGQSDAMLYALSGRLQARLHELPLITLQTIANALPRQRAIHCILERAIQNSLGHGAKTGDRLKVIDGLAFRPNLVQETPAREAADAPLCEEELSEKSLRLLSHGVPQASEFSFERRLGQEEMIGHVAKALTEERHLVVEAGTGTGKSLAYLLPSILFAKDRGERVVLATHTIALQEQLFHKDIRVVAETAATPFQAALLKGRNQYVCMRKLAGFTKSAAMLKTEERDFFVKMVVWLTDSEVGDREEVAMSAVEQDYWRNIQSETETSLNKRCPFFKDCFYFRARQRAQAADIVITNHSLVLSDLMTDHRVLPSYQFLIIDEAHQLEDQATKQLGAEVSEDSMRHLAERLLSSRGGLLSEAQRSFAKVAAEQSEWQPLSAIAERLERTVNTVAGNIQDLFMVISELANSLFGGRSELRITGPILSSPSYAQVKEAAEQVAISLRALGNAIADCEMLLAGVELEEYFHSRLQDAMGFTREFLRGAQVCTDVALSVHSEDRFVGWAARLETKRGRTHLSFHLAPLSVAEVLRTELFDKKAAIVCTSATLSVAGRLTYFEARVGLSELKKYGRVDEAIVKSPFSYQEQALLCVPLDMPDVRDGHAFLAASGKAISQIVKTARGRTMVLFTSYQMMEAVYKAERSSIHAAGIRIFVQGHHDHRRSHLVAAFRKAERAVLFGVNSFWEGIDIQGEDLSCLIIVKLPFAVPTHPVIEARTERLRKEGRDSFREYSVPQAIVRFTQGFGRLIRSKSDRGVVFVLDTRIVKSNYGRMFIESLPEPKILLDTLEATRRRSAEFFPS